jgi:glycosyltransferase involved in cell wall biosynthesis
MGRTILACDWIEPFGGAESVVGGIASNLLNPQIRTLWNDSESFQRSFDVVESNLAKFESLRRNKKLAVPFMDTFWRKSKIEDDDVVIASSHLFAHHINPNPVNGHKFAYIHTPARYVWAPEVDERAGIWAKSFVMPLLKSRDRLIASEITSLAANSEYIRKRVEKSWGLESRVIYPPVDTLFYSANPRFESINAQDQRVLDLEPGYLLSFSRFVPYKKIDIAVKFALEAKQQIVVAGSGELYPELEKLVNEHPDTVQVVHSPTNHQVRLLYAKARALLFFGVEDFGIVPVEAMASGTPVIGLDRGGTRETVLNGKTGILLDNLDLTEFKVALRHIDQISKDDCTSHAESFSKQRFVRDIRSWLPPNATSEMEVIDW